MIRSMQAFNSLSESSLMGFHGASMLEPDADAPAVAALSSSRRQTKPKATSAAPPALTCLQLASGARERSLQRSLLLFDSAEVASAPAP